MVHIIADVLGNFGEYKNIVIPTTGRKQDTAKVSEMIINEKFSYTVIACREW